MWNIWLEMLLSTHEHKTTTYTNDDQTCLFLDIHMDILQLHFNYKKKKEFEDNVNIYYELPDDF